MREREIYNDDIIDGDCMEMGETTSYYFQYQNYHASFFSNLHFEATVSPHMCIRSDIEVDHGGINFFNYFVL